jgi:Lar family restriction alleviation protein
MTTLKPCPFCGGKAYFERLGTPRQSCIVACENCGARHESGDEGDRSGESWNDRAAPEAQPLTMADLCQDCDHGLRGGRPCQSCGGSGLNTTPAPEAQTAYVPLSDFERMRLVGDEFPIALVDPLVLRKVESVVEATEAEVLRRLGVKP